MAVNVGALNQVYNHYMTEYAPKTNSPLDTHKTRTYDLPHVKRML